MVQFTADKKFSFTPDEQPQDENTVLNSREISVDDSVSDDFDMEKHIGPVLSNQLDTVSEYISKQDALAELKIAAFMRANGVDNESMDAHRQALMSATGNNTSTGLLGNIKEGWNNGKIDIKVGDIGVSGLYGKLTPEQVREQTAELEKTKGKSTANWYQSWAKSAAEVMPSSTESLKGGLTGAGAGAAVGAGVAAVGGQLGPQVAIPEEIATVPAGALTGARWGFTAGSFKRSAEIEAGMAYVELINMKDEQGNYLAPEIVRPLAGAIGVINGALEVVKLKTIIKTIPGGKKLLQKAQ